MANYVKSVNFEIKDLLPSSDPDKIIKGAEFETEFDAIAAAIQTKSDIISPTYTGTANFENIAASATVTGVTGTFSGAVTGSNLNISNWDSAFGWGDHAVAGYISSVGFSDIDAAVVNTSGESWANNDATLPTTAAVQAQIAAAELGPTAVISDLSDVNTAGAVTDQLLSYSGSAWIPATPSSVIKATQTKTYLNGEQSQITLSEAVTSAPIVSVEKEVPQVGVTNNTWDQTSNAFSPEDTAPNTGLTLAKDLSLKSLTQIGSSSDNYYTVNGNSTNQGMTFKPDGSAMYTVSNTGTSARVYQINLATPFMYDSTTDTQVLQYDPPSGATSTMYAIELSPDGTRMYVADDVTVYSYTLSTAWNITTATFDTRQYNTTSQTDGITDIHFSSDGTKMYVSDEWGSGTNYYELFEYTLATPWQVDSATYIGNLNLTPLSLDDYFTSFPASRNLVFTFNADLSVLFVHVPDAYGFYRYDLPTPGDLSTAVFNTNDYSRDTRAYTGLFWDDTNKTLVSPGQSYTYIYESIEVIATATLDSGSFTTADVGSQIYLNATEYITLLDTAGAVDSSQVTSEWTTVAAGAWSMYSVNAASQLLLVNGALPPEYRLLNSSYSTVANRSQTMVSQSAFVVDESGRRQIYQDGSYHFYQDNHSVEGIASSRVASLPAYTSATSARGIDLPGDGTYAFYTEFNGIRRLTCRDPWYFDSGATSLVSVTVALSNVYDIAVAHDGTYVLLANAIGPTGSPSGGIYQATMSTPFDLTTLSGFTRILDGRAGGVAYSYDGLHCYVGFGDQAYTITHYELSTPYDLTTRSEGSIVDTAADIYSLSCSKDYIFGVYSNQCRRWSIPSSGTGYSPKAPATAITSAAGTIDTEFWTDLNSVAITDSGDGERYIAFSTDGKQTFSIGQAGQGSRNIVRNNGGTWEVNTAAGTPVLGVPDNWVLESTMGLNRNNIGNGGLAFSEDGLKAFSHGTGYGDHVYEWPVPSSLEIGAMSAGSNKFTSATNLTSSRGVYLKPDGTRFYSIDQGSNPYIWQYDMSTPWDVSTASSNGQQIFNSQLTSIYSAYMNPTGTRLFVGGYTTGSVYRVLDYTLGTPWDITTATYNSDYDLGFASPYTGIGGNSDGTKLYVSSSNRLYTINLAIAYNLASATGYDLFISPDIQTSQNGGMWMPADKSYALITSSQLLYKFNTSTQYTTSETWTAAARNNLGYALSEAMTYPDNRLTATQAVALSDDDLPALGTTLDLAVILDSKQDSTNDPRFTSAALGYDANTLNQVAVPGTDYIWDHPDSTTVRITSLGDYNLKTRVV